MASWQLIRHAFIAPIVRVEMAVRFFWSVLFLFGFVIAMGLI